MFDRFVIQATPGRHDNDARAGIDGEGALAIAVGDLEEQTGDGTALDLNNKGSASGVLEDIGSVFALQEPDVGNKRDG